MKNHLILSFIFLMVLLNSSFVYSQTTGTFEGQSYPIYGKYTGEVYTNRNTSDGSYGPEKTYAQIKGDSLYVTIERYGSKGELNGVDVARINIKMIPPLYLQVNEDYSYVPQNKGTYYILIICIDPPCGVESSYSIVYEGLFTHPLGPISINFMDKESADKFLGLLKKKR